MPPRGRKKNDTRMDAALDAMGAMGFARAMVKAIVKELLKVYTKEGWPFIEDNSYRLLIETILEKQEELDSKQVALHGGENPAESSAGPLSQSCITCGDHAFDALEEVSGDPQAALSITMDLPPSSISANEELGTEGDEGQKSMVEDHQDEEPEQHLIELPNMTPASVQVDHPAHDQDEEPEHHLIKLPNMTPVSDQVDPLEHHQEEEPEHHLIKLPNMTPASVQVDPPAQHQNEEPENHLIKLPNMTPASDQLDPPAQHQDEEPEHHLIKLTNMTPASDQVDPPAHHQDEEPEHHLDEEPEHHLIQLPNMTPASVQVDPPARSRKPKYGWIDENEDEDHGPRLIDLPKMSLELFKKHYYSRNGLHQPQKKHRQSRPKLSPGSVDLRTRDFGPSLEKSNMLSEEYKNAVLEAKEHILAGDIFQIVLSQRFERRTFADPFEIYRALRIVNPSPYMTYLQARGCILVASSPEILTRVKKNKIVNRPLAGTSRRGKTSEEDKRLEVQLLNDAKQCAEHIMLVDLGRNDVGKVSKNGSVKVEKLMNVEYYSHVMHISSTVIGELNDGLTCWDALRAALPVGTVSGAPKVRPSSQPSL
ncbi:hypothetical protein SAY86_017665 [Trapa natans]|uniref:Uncharacterized protein n=1 Tax=Trapa natans TaxID=22666 RepID=A0AAN7LPV1_TRANT|nr:hypothetical protein SAY86_017665 [Trapa natans]